MLIDMQTYLFIFASVITFFNAKVMISSASLYPEGSTDFITQRETSGARISTWHV